MCGIAGIVAFNKTGEHFLAKINPATDCLIKRGPDDSGIYLDNGIALGHRRLSIIDTSHAAVQPMGDPSGRYQIIFNGEFFNYKSHRSALEKEGVVFKTQSDTEVLLNLYIKQGPGCLENVNGFFALAIYDKTERTLFIARDRLGVKPLVYYFDNDKLFFASEVKSMLAMGVERALDMDSLHLYFQLNYLPPDVSIFKNIKKMKPGAFMLIHLDEKKVPEEEIYYTVPYQRASSLPKISFDDACIGVHKLLDEAVQRRLVSDVPLGAFLSGGLDSSIITALASRHVNKLSTFSIGFSDQPHFDETHYAEIVAKKFNTDHHTFKLTTDDLLNGMFDMLDYLDDPFADSSALNVYILCKETRKKVTVALSGDGADELFGGYQKHRAEWIIRNNPSMTFLLNTVAPLMSGFHGSRDGKFANKLRQLQRFSKASSLSVTDRYWQWCSISSAIETTALITAPSGKRYNGIRKQYTEQIDKQDLNSLLNADMQLVLAGDMLVKVDLMSMANSLEVRNPFIDKELVKYAFSLPAEYKIDGTLQKRVVREAFRDVLPNEIYNRPKKGFEVPLLSWFQNELRSLINDDLLSDDFIRQQELFNLKYVQQLKARLYSPQPGDVAGKIWALIVFQYWYKKYLLG